MPGEVQHTKARYRANDAKSLRREAPHALRESEKKPNLAVALGRRSHEELVVGSEEFNNCTRVCRRCLVYHGVSWFCMYVW